MMTKGEKLLTQISDILAENRARLVKSLDTVDKDNKELEQFIIGQIDGIHFAGELVHQALCFGKVTKDGLNEDR